ncbi:hypothetical protein K505DRAFT_342627 [Melanomma pulvis-pyrius CBS 109.77]|uniref:Uncharacterized protein n=1 Tax=Melanomma pulvis-pyrius CBS 109.77 TaxID=1314802 RepID=A0A6A6WV63_9PLEO|nr:hypothetical protein K505DRAFT_342627 [Melanomma pulvis-pyrius CBS 109.77]
MVSPKEDEKKDWTETVGKCEPEQTFREFSLPKFDIEDELERKNKTKSTPVVEKKKIQDNKRTYHHSKSSSVQSFATADERPQPRRLPSKMRLDKMPYAPRIHQRKMTIGEWSNHKHHEPDLMSKPNSRPESKDDDNWKNVDLKDDKIPDMLVSENEGDKFELVGRMCPSEHNGTRRRWWKGFRH